MTETLTLRKLRLKLRIPNTLRSHDHLPQQLLQPPHTPDDAPLEDVRHLRIVVLPRMDEAVFQRHAVRSMRSDALDERRHLHKVGPGAGDDEQFKFSIHLMSDGAGFPTITVGFSSLTIFST